MKNYYETWKSHLNAKHTAMATADQRKAINKLIHHPAQLTKMPPVPNLQLSSPTVAAPAPPSHLHPSRDSYLSTPKFPLHMRRMAMEKRAA